MLRSVVTPFLLVVVLSSTALAGAPLIEVTAGKKVYVGKEVGSNSEQYILMAQDGRVHLIDPNTITKRRTVGDFRAWPNTVIKDRLLREFGSGYASASSRHYVVIARDSRLAEKFARLFEETYVGIRQYFSVRGVAQTEPEFPLPAIIFPNQASFAKYAATDELPAARGMRGYYHNLTNRVALFEDDAAAARADGLPDDEFVWGSLSGNQRDTAVHEATHQVAFNTGLHRRLGSNPKWIVEGLATVFETSGIRNSGSTASSRVNPERFIWFGNFKKERRKPKSLTEVITGDDLFQVNALDAYSEAWALTFYLMETRSRDYSKYLATVAKRDPFRLYTADQKLADFQAVFGKDMGLLEAQYLRFISGLKR